MVIQIYQLPNSTPLEMEHLNYEEMTVKELKVLAEERDINITSNMKKAEIIELINSNN